MRIYYIVIPLDMADCGECIIVKDFLTDLGIKNLGCGAKGARWFRSTLKTFFMDTHNLPARRVVQTELVVGDGDPLVAGLNTITTEFPVYRFIGVFGTSSCSGCLMTMNQCGECNECAYCDDGSCGSSYNWKAVIASEADVGQELKVGQYTVCGTEIKINIPTDLENGYLVYIRGPEALTNIETDEICYPDEYLKALEYLVMNEYSIRDGEYDVANYFKPLYTEYLEKLKDMKVYSPYRIGSPGLSIG